MFLHRAKIVSSFELLPRLVTNLVHIFYLLYFIYYYYFITITIIIIIIIIIIGGGGGQSTHIIIIIIFVPVTLWRGLRHLVQQWY
eukprot:gene12442-8531_t